MKSLKEQPESRVVAGLEVNPDFMQGVKHIIAALKTLY